MPTLKASITKVLFAVFSSVYFLAILSSASYAHHSSSEFTNAGVELEGTLLRVNWRNPHPSLSFQVSDTNELWNIQLPGSIESLRSKNITAASFPIGQQVKIAGLSSRRINNYAQGTQVVFSDGSELNFQQAIQAPVIEPSTAETLLQVAQVQETALTASNPDLLTSAEKSRQLSTIFKTFFVFSLFASLLTASYLFSFRKRNLQASV